jgi:hypothetical protein
MPSQVHTRKHARLEYMASIKAAGQALPTPLPSNFVLRLINTASRLMPYRLHMQPNEAQQQAVQKWILGFSSEVVRQRAVQKFRDLQAPLNIHPMLIEAAEGAALDEENDQLRISVFAALGYNNAKRRRYHAVFIRSLLMLSCGGLGLLLPAHFFRDLSFATRDVARTHGISARRSS